MTASLGFTYQQIKEKFSQYEISVEHNKSSLVTLYNFKYMQALRVFDFRLASFSWHLVCCCFFALGGVFGYNNYNNSSNNNNNKHKQSRHRLPIAAFLITAAAANVATAASAATAARFGGSVVCPVISLSSSGCGCGGFWHWLWGPYVRLV